MTMRPVPLRTSRVGFGSGAGQELENVLHLRHDLEGHIDAGFACELRQRTAVVEQRLIGTSLDIHRRQTCEVGVERIGQRVSPIAALAEKHPGHRLDHVAGGDKVLLRVRLERRAGCFHVEPGRQRHGRGR